MKQSLELKFGQRLTMTPQLQQAIRLLQLSALELEMEIREALETNPLLEENETEQDEQDDGETGGEAVNGNDEQPVRDSDLELTDGAALAETSDLPTDWAEEFETPIVSNVRNSTDDLSFDYDGRNSSPITLRDHLEWQYRMTPCSETDRAIGQAIVDSLSDDGYLTCDLADIQQALAEDIEVELDEIEAMLHLIQNFDPSGVGARDLSECLVIQLRQMPANTPGLTLAMEIATHHLAALGKRDFAQLKRAIKATDTELQEAITLIQSLNPRPGSQIDSAQASYVVPDIVVKKIGDIWHAELNADTSPALRINRTYQSMIRRGDTSVDNRYIQDQLQEARWFIKSLHNRNETLLRVARAIVERQTEFLEKGDEAMKPMVLSDIAEALSMHESTISRATTQKYMLTPRGIFELKYFFSSRVSTVDGGTCSSTVIRSLIKKLVDTEPPTRPISDSQIAKLLADKGFTVARRTVAKYRENMHIPPSNQRKSLI
ncbi:MAG: RNA polymerase factor sigma-54 [Gammaproteobacteria bacterium]|nr:RNA polymerase factor sigma-54 [Gammaproteobacteria bacterium]